MPRVKNIGQGNISIETITGGSIVLAPNEEGDALRFPRAGMDLEVVSREPLFKAIVKIEKVTAASDAYVELDPLCDRFAVDQIDGEITVYAEADSPENRIPLIMERTSGGIIISVCGIYDRLVINGSGTCVVSQMQDMP